MAVGNSKRAFIVDMNVTPLIDVLLVLIISFMVVTNLTPRGLDALTPHESSDAARGTIVVTIDAARNIRINQTAVDINGFASQLEDIFKTRNDRIIFIKGDSSLHFADVAQVIDIAKGANIDKIGLITAKLEEGQ